MRSGFVLGGGYRHCGRRGVAQSGLARLTGGQKVAGSNPVAPILTSLLWARFFFSIDETRLNLAPFPKLLSVVFEAIQG